MRSTARITGLAIVALLTVACSDTAVDSTTSAPSVVATTSPPTTTQEITAESLGITGLEFSDFLEESYSRLLVRDPERLTGAGVAHLYGMANDQLNDYSEPFILETGQIELAILDQLRSYDHDKLSGGDQISYDVYEWYLDQQVRGHRFRYHDWPVHYFVNAYNTNLLLFLQEVHPMNSARDAEDYIARLTQIPRQVAQVVDGLRIREAMGVIPHRTIVERTINSLSSDLNGGVRLDLVDGESLALYTSFEARLSDVAGLNEDERQELLDDALVAVEDSFAPAWIDLRNYMRSLIDKAPSDAGVWGRPDGDAYYAYLLRDHTSTEMTPDEVHEMGLAQVERVQSEMREAFDRLGYPAGEHLPDLLLEAYGEAGILSGSTPAGRDNIVAIHEDLITAAESVFRSWFGSWPRASVEVVPDAGGGGFYVAGSVDGSRPGLFHAGTGSQVPLLSLPTINYHEAVPGHHTQIALSQELELPTFRRAIQYNGFAEGWALYAERLAAEAGLYEDWPYGNIGRLEMELLRAVRLVVDTGIHYKRWSRAEAHAYMNEVVPIWSREVERYMVLPGQATSYMIGQQEILRLRTEAQATLGSAFDIAAFHSAVLESGSVPLTVLEQVVYDSLGMGNG